MVFLSLFLEPSHLLLLLGDLCVCLSSSLDALEAAEEAHAEYLRSIAQKEAPDPIGAATALPVAGMGQQQQGGGGGVSNAADQMEITSATSTRTRFWNQVRASAGTGSTTTPVGAAAVAAASSNPSGVYY